MDDAVLVFNSSRLTKEYRKTGKKVDEYKIKISEIKEIFHDFEINSLEIWLEGGIKTGKLTELIVSAEGKGGIKLTLKPKDKS